MTAILKQANFKTLSLALVTALTLTATGCSTIKGLTGKDKKSDVVETATKSAEGYYNEASTAIAKGRYSEATIALNNVRTFYPTSSYAEQALLDLIYAYYNAGDLEATTVATAQFLQSYPTSPNADYALYAQGVTHMQGSPKAPRLFKLTQSERDPAFLRLAFADFQKLITNYPNSSYAPDSALRMRAIYNQFAEHELQAAYWYIKREAYVAAAGRAKWVFQYYPQSPSVPEAIAILAHSNEKLGLTTTADQYKTLLKINYPNYLTSSNKVRLPKAEITLTQKTLSAISLGKLGRIGTISHEGGGNYEGQTYTQVIVSAQGLQLPAEQPPSP